MKYQIFQVDAFTNKIFRGNPACVVPLFEWLPDDVLLRIAKENAVAETAFFIETEKDIHLRWFTPDLEIDLCGHATLAAAHALKACLNYPSDEITFTTLSGILKVSCKNNFYYLNFPSRRAVKAYLPHVFSKYSILYELSSADFVKESQPAHDDINNHLYASSF
jgi:PhzF family phenazine biosynthesis protein